MKPSAPPVDWVDYLPVLQAVAGVQLDEGQLRRARAAAQRVHVAVFDPSVEEIVAALRTDATLQELADVIETVGKAASN